MSKKYLELVAATLLSVKPGDGFYDGAAAMREQWTDTVAHFAENCARTNPKFDRPRFLRACGMES